MASSVKITVPKDYTHAALSTIITTTKPQVLTAAGVLPLSSDSDSSAALTQATDVITACTTDFLVPALAAGVDVSGLVNLPTQCNFDEFTGSRDCILASSLSMCAVCC